jgi:tetratricopeptide (TPR) repeat protein
MVSHPKIEIAMKMNYWKSISICLIAFSILVCAMPALAQESTLQVKCVDEAGALVPGVKVSVVSLKSPQKPKDKKSDAQGGAEFTKLEDGAYRVFGRKDGFVPALYEFALLKGSQVPVTLKFAAGADKKLWFEDPVEEQKAIALLTQGFDAAKQNKTPEGEKLFREAILIRPSYAEAYYYLGLSLMQQSKYEEGIQALDKASQLANAWLSAQPDQKIYIAIVQQVEQTKKDLPARKAEDAFRRKDYESAVKGFKEAIQANPNEPEHYASLAVSLINLQKLDEASAAIDKAIQLKPAPNYAQIQKAIAERKESAGVQKAQVLFEEGTKLLNDGDAAAALKKFEEAKGMVPQASQSPIWKQIGRAQAKLNQPEAADSFKKAIELAPADKLDEFRKSFAQYYLDQKKYEEALNTLIDPKSTESPEKILLSLAKASKDPRLSKIALERVLKLNPDNLDACLDLGQMYYSDKDDDKRAKELLTKYVEKGQDPTKLESAKAMIIMIGRRTK